MKKLFLSLALLMGLSVISDAGTKVPNLIYEVGISSITLFKIQASSWQATQMDNPTLTERVSIEVQNIDSTNNLWCMPGVSVSSAPINGCRKIAPGASWVVSILDKFPKADAGGIGGTVSPHVYCMTDNISTSTVAIVTQVR